MKALIWSVTVRLKQVSKCKVFRKVSSRKWSIILTTKIVNITLTGLWVCWKPNKDCQSCYKMSAVAIEKMQWGKWGRGEGVNQSLQNLSWANQWRRTQVRRPMTCLPSLVLNTFHSFSPSPPCFWSLPPTFQVSISILHSGGGYTTSDTQEGLYRAGRLIFVTLLGVAIKLSLCSDPHPLPGDE